VIWQWIYGKQRLAESALGNDDERSEQKQEGPDDLRSAGYQGAKV